MKFSSKIDMIKRYRDLTGAGLKESKDAIEKYGSVEATLSGGVFAGVLSEEIDMLNNQFQKSIEELRLMMANINRKFEMLQILYGKDRDDV